MTDTAVETPLSDSVASALDAMRRGRSMIVMDIPDDSSYSSYKFTGDVSKEIARRADLAAVPAQVRPDCCDICRGKTFAGTADGKGWRCVECKAIWLREPQPDTRDEVIARLVGALEMAKVWLDYNGAYDMQGINAAIAAAKAVQHG